MTLFEFADIINKQIRTIYYPNQDGRFCTAFDSCEVKNGGCLVGEHANATDVEVSLNEYARLIQGKCLVFNAMSENRQEFTAPKSFQLLGE